jgi:four helix bundle protein
MMPMVRTYRDLIAWQKAMMLTQAIYLSTRAMPKEEMFGLTAQMRRAAVSVPSNIAEGHGRQSRADYLKFLRIARGSLAELGTQMELAARMEMLRDTSSIQESIREVDRILQGLIRSLERKTTS